MLLWIKTFAIAGQGSHGGSVDGIRLISIPVCGRVSRFVHRIQCDARNTGMVHFQFCMQLLFNQILVANLPNDDALCLIICLASCQALNC